MHKPAIDNVLTVAGNKLSALENNPRGFFIASMIAGMFITFGAIISMSIGGYVLALGSNAFGIAKISAAIAFASALSLVITAGCELFTGNNFTVGMIGLDKPKLWGKVAALWAFCWLGNLVGSWITIAVYHYAGADSVPVVSEYFASVSAAKLSFTPFQMILRGILCNVLVCLAVWCTFKLKEETSRLIMTVWCILIFMVAGFEHSIANMSIVGISLIHPCGKEVLTLGNYFYDLFFVTIGNILGAVCFLALPYYAMTNRSKA